MQKPEDDVKVEDVDFAKTIEEVLPTIEEPLPAE